MALTSLQDTLYNPNGTTANGNIYLTWASFTAADGKVVNGSAAPLIIEIVNGVLNISLEPTDTATPSGSYYVATYNLGTPYAPVEHWNVPTSGSPVNLAAVRTLP